MSCTIVHVQVELIQTTHEYNQSDHKNIDIDKNKSDVITNLDSNIISYYHTHQ